MFTPSLPRSRLDQLRGALSSSVDALHRRHAADIPTGYIEDYVSLSWLEWDGGHLRLTVVGTNILQQLGLEAGGTSRPQGRPGPFIPRKKGARGSSLGLESILADGGDKRYEKQYET